MKMSIIDVLTEVAAGKKMRKAYWSRDCYISKSAAGYVLFHSPMSTVPFCEDLLLDELENWEEWKPAPECFDFRAACHSLLVGQKVGRTSWSDDQYIYMDKHGDICHMNGDPFVMNRDDLEGKDWYVFEF